MSLSSRKIKNQIYNSLIIIWLNFCRMWRHNDVVLEDGYVKYSPVSWTGFKILHFLIRIKKFWTILENDQLVNKFFNNTSYLKQMLLSNRSKKSNKKIGPGGFPWKPTKFW